MTAARWDVSDFDDDDQTPAGRPHSDPGEPAFRSLRAATSLVGVRAVPQFWGCLRRRPSWSPLLRRTTRRRRWCWHTIQRLTRRAPWPPMSVC